MTRSLVIRVVYIRITDENGKRKWQEIGTLNRKGEFKLNKGIPLPGLFEV